MDKKDIDIERQKDIDLEKRLEEMHRNFVPRRATQEEIDRFTVKEPERDPTEIYPYEEDMMHPEWDRSTRRFGYYFKILHNIPSLLERLTFMVFALFVGMLFENYILDPLFWNSVIFLGHLAKFFGIPLPESDWFFVSRDLHVDSYRYVEKDEFTGNMYDFSAYTEGSTLEFLNSIVHNPLNYLINYDGLLDHDIGLFKWNEDSYLINLDHFWALKFEIIFLIIFFGIFGKMIIESSTRDVYYINSRKTLRRSIYLLCLLLYFGYSYNSDIFFHYIGNLHHTSENTTYTLVHYALHYKLIFYDTMIIDEYSTYLKIIFVLLTMSALGLARNYIRFDDFYQWEYSILIMFLFFGLMCLISSFNFLLFFICLEFLAITSYFLTGLNYKNPLGSEAALKYFILGSLASFFLTFGIALIYGFFGTLSFTEIYYKILLIEYIYNTVHYTHLINSLVVIGIISITINFLFKVSSAPFHFWTPDVYDAAPLPLTAFFATVMKVGLIVSYLRIFYFLFLYFSNYIQPVLIIGSICSMVIGSFGGLYQRKLKRLFAYSTITHMGYLLMAIATFEVTAIKAILLYLLVYSVTMLGVFGFLISSVDYLKLRRMVYITDVTRLGIHRHNIFIFGCFTFLIFSLAGIPPLAGFYTKWFIFEAVMSTNLWPLAFLGIFTSLVSCFYYLRVLKICFFDKLRDKINSHMLTQLREPYKTVIVGSAMFVIIFQFIIDPFCNFIDVCLIPTLMDPFALYEYGDDETLKIMQLVDIRVRYAAKELSLPDVVNETFDTELD